MKKLLLFLVCLVFFTLTSANAEAEETYYGDKVWTISFNMEVDRNTINEDNIFIKNASGQTLKNIELTLDTTNTQVYVDALDDYLPGQYTLHISDQVKSARGDYLKTSTTKTFTIESYGPITILEKSQLNDTEKKLLENWEVYFQREYMNMNSWTEAQKISKGSYYLGEDLYIVTTGLKPHGGYNIRLNNIDTDVNQTVVYVEDVQPSSDPNIEYPAIIDYPFIIIKSTVPPNATLSFLIDEHNVPIKDVPLSNL